MRSNALIAAIVLAACGCSTISTEQKLAEPAAIAQETTMDIRVKQDGTKVWIDGVSGFNAGEYASSVQGSQARILQVIGEPVTYDDLVCYGAFAFRVGLHSSMCPSAGHPCCGYMTVSNDRAIPWRLTVYDAGSPRAKTDRAAFEREACSAVKASIDRGIPVHYGSEEDGLIIGYANQGRRWLCIHPYHKEGKEAFWHDEATGFAGGQWPWGIEVWVEPKPPSERIPAREATVAALKQALDMWSTEKRDDYYCGDAAYQRWISWLLDVNSGKAADPKGGMQGNGWCYDVLIQNRRIAARWLKQKADLFDAPAAEQLRLAADHYAQIPEICLKDLSCSWDLAPHPDRYAQWTPQMRSDQASRLAAAREHDRAAIAAIEKALVAADELAAAK